MSNSDDRSSKTNAVSLPHDTEMNLVSVMQMGAFGGVTTLVCTLLRMIKIVSIDMLHQLFEF